MDLNRWPYCLDKDFLIMRCKQVVLDNTERCGSMYKADVLVVYNFGNHAYMGDLPAVSVCSKKHKIAFLQVFNSYFFAKPALLV